MRGKTVLILDDDAGVRRLLVRRLSADGWRVVAIEAAALLPEALSGTPFAAAFFDIGLGEGVDGVALALGVRDSHPDLPVIMMSGEPESLDRARSAGFAWILPKPFSAEQLGGVLSRALPES